MKQEKRLLKLPEGHFDTNVLIFEEEDRKTLYDIYKNWRNLCDNLGQLSARGVNLPEGLSESAFCLEMNTIRVTESISKANTSFDCFCLNKHSRIQVKACSVLPDLTSFGPKSVWDEIYFVDFYRNGQWDGTFDIYHIETSDIYNHKVNANQTLREQQQQGRRPRFSIYKELIKVKGIQPVKTGNLNTD